MSQTRCRRDKISSVRCSRTWVSRSLTAVTELLACPKKMTWMIDANLCYAHRVQTLCSNLMIHDGPSFFGQRVYFDPALHEGIGCVVSNASS
jgi:hypothetical protein